jgi:hypothetical protein
MSVPPACGGPCFDDAGDDVVVNWVGACGFRRGVEILGPRPFQKAKVRLPPKVAKEPCKRQGDNKCHRFFLFHWKPRFRVRPSLAPVDASLRRPAIRIALASSGLQGDRLTIHYANGNRSSPQLHAIRVRTVPACLREVHAAERAVCQPLHRPTRTAGASSVRRITAAAFSGVRG